MRQISLISPGDCSYRLLTFIVLFLLGVLAALHYENTPVKFIENFTTKNWKCLDKYAEIFHISAQNIYYGYS